MKTSTAGLKFIVLEEGEHLKAYQDSVGIWTIGVGHTGFVDNTPVVKGLTITQAKSREILQKDLNRFEKAINESVKVALTQHQFDALISLAFNIGEGAFLRSTLLKKLNTSDFKGAAEQFLRWRNAGGKPILLSRRQREKRLFETGRYV